jgi:hypothetical protein
MSPVTDHEEAVSICECCLEGPCIDPKSNIHIVVWITGAEQRLPWSSIATLPQMKNLKVNTWLGVNRSK